MTWRRPAPRVALTNLGCRVNRVELDVMARSLQRAGCELVGEADADAIVVNTCAVTGEAQAKTRKAIRHAAHLPQAPQVVATGCVASLFADELVGIAPTVTVEADKARVPELVLALVGAAGELPGAQGALGGATRETPTGRTRPGIKIQDGCDNRCSFCIVWKARGPSRSARLADVLDDVRDAERRGVREVVLTGINLGSYRGRGEDGPLALPGLIATILGETGVGRLRLGSIEPPDVTEELLGVMAGAGERVAPFLHVCLQSGCDETLRRMGRAYDSASYAAMASMARSTLPGLSLGTDLIVGFPGESEAQFERSRAFCEEMAFSRMHVFRYSRRPGTPAASLPGQLDPAEVARRGERMLRLASSMRRAQAARLVASEQLVVVQRRGVGVTGGLFDALVDADAPVGELVRARVSGTLGDGTLDARGPWGLGPVPRGVSSDAGPAGRDALEAHEPYACQADDPR